VDQNITYRIATEDDHAAILELYNSMYSTNRSLKDFRWLVTDNPAGKAILFIALKVEKVVGMQSLIPYSFVRNGKSIETYKSEDTLVDKELRGKGIFSKLYEMVHAHAEDKLVWGLTDKKEILERVKMPSSERLTIAVSVKRPSIMPDRKGLHRLVAKTLFYTVLYFKSTFRTKKVEGRMKPKEISTESYGRAELKDFFTRLSTEYPTIIFPQMSPEYLQWRLNDNPNLDRYRMNGSLADDGKIAICSIIGVSDKEAYWQSFYALKDVPMDEKIAHINALRKKLFQSGVNVIHTWLFECNTNVKEVKALFFQAGFSKVRDGLWIVHNSTDMEIDVHDLYFSPQLGIR